MRPLTLVSILVLVSITALTAAAQAQVTYTVTPTAGGDIVAPGTPLTPGTILTLDIQLTTDGSPIAAIGASAYDYEANGLSFTPGQGLAAERLLATTCLPSVGCNGGLSGSTNPVEVLSGPTAAVRFFNHLNVLPSSEDGSADLGADGQPGTAQATLNFFVLQNIVFQGGQTIEVGTSADYADAIVLGDATTGVAQTLWVVPEPGSALLMGLGLLGLGRVGRGPRAAT